VQWRLYSFAALICSGLAFSIDAYAQSPSPTYFANSPGSTRFELGRGFIQNDLAKYFIRDCLKFDRDDSSSNAADNIHLREYVTTSYSSQLDVFGVDANVAVHYAGSSLDAKFSQSRRLSSDNRNVNIIVEASADYGFVSIRNVQVKDEYQKLLDAGQINEFRDQCGARVPIHEVKGVRLYASITIVDASTDLQQKSSASVDVSVGKGPLSATAKAAFNQELDKAQKDHRVEVTVFARGGRAEKVLEEETKAVIKEKVSVDDIGAALAKYAGTMSKDFAATLGYDVADMPGLDVALKDPWSVEKQQKLTNILTKYWALQDKRGILDALISKADQRYQIYTPQQLGDFKVVEDKLDQAKERLITIHSGCKAALAPQLQPCDFDSSDFDALLALPTPKALEAPRGKYVLAVREGSGNKNSQLDDWVPLSRADMNSVLRSPIKASPFDGNFNSLSAYNSVNLSRLLSVRNRTKRYIRGYSLYADTLDSLELYAVIEKKTADDPPKIDFVDEFQDKAWGPDELSRFETGNVLTLADNDDRIGNFLFVTGDDYVEQPPPCKCTSMNSPEYRAWEDDYNDQFYHLIFSGQRYELDVTLRSLVRAYVGTGKTSGAAQLRLRARDKFVPEPSELTVANFRWVYNELLDMTEVTYDFNTGERENVAYLTNMTDQNPAAENTFPKSRRNYQLNMSWTNGGGTQSRAVPALSSDWGLMGKLCKFDVKLLGRQQIPGLTYSVNSGPAGATITANWNVVQVHGANLDITFEITADYYIGWNRGTFLGDTAGCN
jgi:hypothetical protein